MWQLPQVRNVLPMLGTLALVLALPLLPVSKAWAQASHLVESSAADGFSSRTTQSASPPLPPSKRIGLNLQNVPETLLPALSAEGVIRQNNSRETKNPTSGPVRIGVDRNIGLDQIQGDWYASSGDRQLWATEIVTPGAIAIRIHFASVHLTPGDEIAVYAPHSPDDVNAEIYGPYYTDKNTDFWTWITPGDRLRVEYFTSQTSPISLPFAIDRLQHIYYNPFSANTKVGSFDDDVACHPEWAAAARGVAAMIYNDGGPYFCNGQLLRTEKDDLTPYFLTANHCVHTKESAQSAEFYWLFQTPTCDGAPPSFSSVPRSKDATLLSTSAKSDYTLLMIEGTLTSPDKLKWLKWNATHLPDAVSVATIHHPGPGGFKRIAIGKKIYDTNAHQLFAINFTDGGVVPGSSGSGIFRVDTGELVGQLKGIGNTTGNLYAGAFFATYPKIKQNLRIGSDDSFEPNDSCAAARTVKTGTFNDLIVKSVSQDWYKISLPPKKRITISISFINAHGNIDGKMYSTCDGAPVAQSSGGADSEELSFDNNTAAAKVVYWNIYLSNDVRNNYNMKVAIDDDCSASSRALCNPCVSRNDQLAGAWYESEGSDSSLFPSHLTFIKQGPADGRLEGFGEPAFYFLTEDCSGIGVTDSLGRLIVTYSFDLDTCGLRLENWNRRRLYCKGGLHNCPAGCRATGIRQ